jgi:hypothetical protein
MATQIDLKELIDFDDLEPIQVPVKYRGKKFVLVEASADSVIKYRNANMRATRFNTREDGTVTSAGFENIHDPEIMVVSLNLYFADQTTGQLQLNAQGAPDIKFRVAEPAIREWPSRVQSALFERLKQITPDLEGRRDTVDSLEKERLIIDRKLAKLRGDMPDPTNGQPVSTGASSS